MKRINFSSMLIMAYVQCSLVAIFVFFALSTREVCWAGQCYPIEPYVVFV